MTDKWMDKICTKRRQNNFALTHTYHEGKGCSKLGRIPPSGLGGDSVTHRRTVRGIYNIPLSFFLEGVGTNIYIFLNQ